MPFPITLLRVDIAAVALLQHGRYRQDSVQESAGGPSGEPQGHAVRGTRTQCCLPGGAVGGSLSLAVRLLKRDRYG